jgi:hypothetical protein
MVRATHAFDRHEVPEMADLVALLAWAGEVLHAIDEANTCIGEILQGPTAATRDAAAENARA